MKNILIFLSAFLSMASALSQTTNCDSIPWTKERKLSWRDFRADPDTATKDAAQSFIRLHKSWKLRGDSISITVSNYFKPCLAWSKLTNSDTLLLHEQGHFDISEYFRRLFIKRYSEQNFKRQSIKDEMTSISYDLETQQKEFLSLYELKTDFGRNKTMQMEWSNKILSLIDSLSEYNLPVITHLIIE